MIPRFLVCGLGDGGPFTKIRYKIQEKEQAWGGSKEKGEGGEDEQDFYMVKLPVK